MNILITGGAGFIGGSLARSLVQTHQVSIVDNLSSGKIEKIPDGVDFYEIDIRDRVALGRAVVKSQANAIVHLAAMVSVQKSIRQPEECYEINVDGSKNIIDAASNVDNCQIIFASSSAVYGKLSPPLEEEIAMPSERYYQTLLSPYAISKLKAEKLFNESVLLTKNLRFFNIYGPGQNARSEYAAVIAAFIEGIKKNKKVLIYGNGKQSRDFIFIQDVVTAIMKALTIKEKTTINIATGKEISLLELTETLKNITGPFTIEHLTARSGDIEKSYADVSFAQESLDFTARTSLSEGLKQMLDS